MRARTHARTHARTVHFTAAILHGCHVVDPADVIPIGAFVVALEDDDAVADLPLLFLAGAVSFGKQDARRWRHRRVSMHRTPGTTAFTRDMSGKRWG